MLQNLYQGQFHGFADQPNLTGVFFPFMKAVPARFVIQRALMAAERENRQIKYFIETSSGTAALALAYAAQEVQRKLIIIGDTAIEHQLQKELTNLGCEVLLVSDEFKNKPGGFQAERLRLLHRVLGQRADGHWLRQYDNPDWKLAYVHVAAEIIRNLGPVDWFVAGTGSGASSCGIISGLRRAGSATQLVAVDSVNSVLFGAPEGPRPLRGVGMGLLPTNLVHSEFDEVFWTNCAAAWTAANHLHHSYGLPVGPTTGAVWLAATHIARKFPHQRVVFLSADASKRYEPLIFEPEDLKQLGWWLDTLPTGPVEVEHPSQVRPDLPLQRFMWNRRTLERVIQSATHTKNHV